MEYLVEKGMFTSIPLLNDRNVAEAVDISILVMLTRKAFWPSGPYISAFAAGGAWYIYQRTFSLGQVRA